MGVNSVTNDEGKRHTNTGGSPRKNVSRGTTPITTTPTTTTTTTSTTSTTTTTTTTDGGGSGPTTYAYASFCYNGACLQVGGSTLGYTTTSGLASYIDVNYPGYTNLSVGYSVLNCPTCTITTDTTTTGTATCSGTRVTYYDSIAGTSYSVCPSGQANVRVWYDECNNYVDTQFLNCICSGAYVRSESGIGPFGECASANLVYWYDECNQLIDTVFVSCRSGGTTTTTTTTTSGGCSGNYVYSQNSTAPYGDCANANVINWYDECNQLIDTIFVSCNGGGGGTTTTTTSSTTTTTTSGGGGTTTTTSGGGGGCTVGGYCEVIVGDCYRSGTYNSSCSCTNLGSLFC